MYKYNFKFSVFLIHESKKNNSAYYGYIYVVEEKW